MTHKIPLFATTISLLMASACDVDDENDTLASDAALDDDTTLRSSSPAKLVSHANAINTAHAAHPACELASSEAGLKSTLCDDECLEIGQEITVRHHAYNATIVAKDLDQLYDYWTPTFHEFLPSFDADGDGLVDRLTWWFDEMGGNLYAYYEESYERFVHDGVVYDMGAYNNPGDANGEPFNVYGYYFLRWEKGDDDRWYLDGGVAGPRGDTSDVTPTTDAGPVVCSIGHKTNHHQGCEEEIDQEISMRFEAYEDALMSGDAEEAYKFYTHDFRYLGTGLDVDRHGLRDYYHEFFETASIVSSDTWLHNRYIHGNVAYEIGQSDDVVVIDGVQSVEKSNYVIRWEQGYNKKWLIDRILKVKRFY